MTHTPGPWAIKQGTRIEAADGTTVAAIDRFIPPSGADAALIAAAPELLAALIAMIEMERSEKNRLATLKLARAAIAKATGK